MNKDEMYSMLKASVERANLIMSCASAGKNRCGRALTKGGAAQEFMKARRERRILALVWDLLRYAPSDITLSALGESGWTAIADRKRRLDSRQL